MTTDTRGNSIGSYRPPTRRPSYRTPSIPFWPKRSTGRPSRRSPRWAKSGEYITQITGYGPLSIDYLEEKDDPRSQKPPAPRHT